MIDFLSLADAASAEQHAPKMARWIFESGSGFFVSLFGDSAVAEERLQAWVRRENSEFSGLLATLALRDGEAIGLCIALPGKDIPLRRRADLLDLIHYLTPPHRELLKEKLPDLADLTAPVESNDFYLRTIAVDISERGRGVGRKIVERAVADGRAKGFEQFRLDVDSDNEAALGLYRSLGFNSIHEGAAPKCGLRMHSMLLKV